MYYNIRTNQILNNLNINGYLEDGTLVQGLNLADAETVKACGILPVKSDTPEMPENSYEDISQRNIIIEDDGVIVTRVWLSNPIIIPSSISARQVRLWLIDNNIDLNNVTNIINTIEDPILRQKTLVEWEYAPYIERNHPLIETLGASLGLTPEQIDQGFITASQL
jgi:hypothetical protein